MDWSHKPYYSDWDRVEIACPHCSEHIYINETQYENITTITDVDIINLTSKAYHIKWNDEEFWIPKSQARLFKGKSTVTIKAKRWLLRKNGILH